MHEESLDIPGMLEVLTRHGVEFIVVGGVCATLHGAPVMTFDLDIVHHRSADNIDRLIEALKELDAIFRTHPKRITPKASHLETTGHRLLRTSKGALDLLGSLDQGRTYEALLEHTFLIEDQDGMRLRILELTELIEIKSRAGRPKDIAVLPTLRATLQVMSEE